MWLDKARNNITTMQKLLTTKSGELNVFALCSLLAAMPAIIAVFYYGLFAADIYVSESKFSLYSQQQSISQNAGLGSLSSFAGAGGIRSESLEQLLTLEQYIKSYDLLKKLDTAVDLQQMYRHDAADYFSSLSAQPSNKQFLQYYKSMIGVKVNREAAMIDIKVRAFASEDAHKIGVAINNLAEEFINKMLARVKNDALLEAQKFITDAENKVKNVQAELAKFRINNGTVSPADELTSMLELSKILEQKRAEILIEKTETNSLLRDRSATLKTFKSRIEGIKALKQQTKRDIINFSENKGELLINYEMLLLDQEFAREEYKLAVINLEDVVKNQARMNKYIVEILQPTTPDIADEPYRLYKIITISALSFIFFGIVATMISAVRDHIY
jgi:capsular polysaccharide transport system permease protein